MSKNQIEEYLDGIIKMLEKDKCAAYRYYKWVKDKGRFYNPNDIARTPDSFIDYRPKQCYNNSILNVMAFDDRDIKYVEGFFISKEVPIVFEHAWNTLDGKVMDSTNEFILKDEQLELFGVEVEREIIYDFANVLNKKKRHVSTPLLLKYKTENERV